MAHEPSAPAFTQELIDTLPRLLAGKEASLVLFSSYRQMNEVAVGLRAKGMSLLVQGKRPAAPCSSCTNKVRRRPGQHPLWHRQLLGRAGSARPLPHQPGDHQAPLRGAQLPVEEATAEWIEQRGGNPFLQLTVPEASRKLIQACGRLIRKEADRGGSPSWTGAC